ncbi:MAG: type II toxin-antitoxin system RelE/ParE family toxin [Magnetococcales bacterium]|nr:type II toxin-antitoxin system RelE/ParE family toxin [Magnetococcales bacterium]
MSYSLEFHADALKEWKRLDESVRRQFKKKLAERLENPVVPSSRLAGYAGEAYKIKLRTSGYRLVYIVDQDRIVVIVLAVGKREKSRVYQAAEKRQ